jgi:hypothetical protein
MPAFLLFTYVTWFFYDGRKISRLLGCSMPMWNLFLSDGTVCVCTVQLLSFMLNMLEVLARLTILKTKNTFCIIISWFSCSVYAETRQNRPDEMHHQLVLPSQALLASPDDGGSKDLWNVRKRLPDYTVIQSRRQPSCTRLRENLKSF